MENAITYERVAFHMKKIKLEIALIAKRLRV